MEQWSSVAGKLSRAGVASVASLEFGSLRLYGRVHSLSTCFVSVGRMNYCRVLQWHNPSSHKDSVHAGRECPALSYVATVDVIVIGLGSHSWFSSHDIWVANARRSCSAAVPSFLAPRTWRTKFAGARTTRRNLRDMA